jgi:AraC-like DNA-binding protein
VQPNSNPHSYSHYLPIADELLHSGFYVTSAGRDIILPGAGYPQFQHPSLYSFRWEEGRTLPEFSLILISGGRGIFECRKRGQISGAVIQLFPGIWHRYKPDRKTGWTEKWVQFNGEFAHKLLDAGIISQDRPVLHLRKYRPVEAALDSLLKVIHDNPSSNSLHFSVMALRVIAALSKLRLPALPILPPQASGAPIDVVVASALDYIWTRSHRTLSVCDVAGALNVTRRKLERHMMSCKGHSVLEEIIQCRFSRAERLLRETDLPLKVIVSLAGFGSVQNMRYVFLNRTGSSPGSYRLRYREHSSGPRRKLVYKSYRLRHSPLL